jgi:hypothetical protein
MGEPIALEGHLCPELFSAVPHESKSVPQRLKPSSAQTITARLNPCPSFDSLCPSLTCCPNWPTDIEGTRPIAFSLFQGMQCEAVEMPVWKNVRTKRTMRIKSFPLPVRSFLFPTSEWWGGLFRAWSG